MSTIQKLTRSKGFVYRVLIRHSEIKPITKVFKTKRLAIEFSQRIEGNLAAQREFSTLNNSLLMKELVQDYLDNGYFGKRPKEQASKLDVWNKHLGLKQVIKVSSLDISRVLNELSNNLSNATVNRYKAAISVVFSHACRYYNLQNNPMRHLPSLPENNLRLRYLSSNEKKRLEKASRASKWTKLYLLVLMAITTGARKGELMNLRWRDINFDRQTAYVKTTKNGQPKVLPLTNDVVEELTKFKQQDMFLIFNSEIKPNKAFCFDKQWKKALELAKLDNFRFHDLRHTTASYLALSGASLLEIADVLGHKQISVTQRYAHLCIDHKSKLINRVMGGTKF